MEVEIRVSHRFDLESFSEGVALCSEDPRRIPKVLASHNLPDAQESLISLCLATGVRNVMRRVLQKEEEVKELCDYYGVQVFEDDERDVMIERVVAHLMETEYPFEISGLGFFSLGKYIKDINQANKWDDKESALECANRIEQLIIDVHCLYVGELLYEYLGERQKKIIKATLKANSVKFGTRISQLRRLEKDVRDGTYSGLAEELEKRNGQTSIFGSANLDSVQQTSTIRGVYLAHKKYPDTNFIAKKCRDLFQYADEFIQACVQVMPKIIFPVQTGVDEWGSQFVAYLDEKDLDINGNIRKDTKKFVMGKINVQECERFYVLRNPVKFYPFQQVYCLHPTKSSIMHDPSIFYQHDLRKIGNRL